MLVNDTQGQAARTWDRAEDVLVLGEGGVEGGGAGDGGDRDAGEELGDADGDIHGHVLTLQGGYELRLDQRRVHLFLLPFLPFRRWRR